MIATATKTKTKAKAKTKAKTERAYAIDLGTPIHFVALALDTAAPAAVSERKLAADYRHGLTADLSRVKHHEDGVKTDDDAKAWMIREAITILGKNALVVTEAEGGDRLIAFADGKGFDNLRWNGKRLTRPEPDIHAVLGDAFNPMSGRFSENIRRFTGKDNMTELRDSMKSFGWVKEFPAIQDERGVVLVGHRRMAVAKELGIEPVIKTVVLGKGDAADAERFKLAIVSNLAAKPFTPEERKEIAVYLYKDHEWSQERIAEALNVNQGTVSRDVAKVSKKAKNGGRPRGEHRNPLLTTDAERVIAEAVLDKGKTLEAAVKDVGVGSVQVAKMAVAKELGRREGRAEALSAPRLAISSVIEHAPTTASVEEQLARLMEAWEAAGVEARREFQRRVVE